MQMSIERFREVHKLIWNTVIEHAQEVKVGEVSIQWLKRLGIDTAYRKGLLDFDEAVFITKQNNCLLCAAFPSCENCVLEDCKTYGSLYNRASFGNISAMLKIRDIVDKKPFNELAIITLYMWCL